ncbi:MAG TPA: Ldh family oxidoreductase [Paracoccaceae bacterium]|nr:Ldh family oxidoreductase [Paracoccaceae bacterium]HMO71931.1 Ldh family oxidoreductase [Paracoccaceae bacterium]
MNATLPIPEARALAMAAMAAHGFAADSAEATVEALILADRDGIPSHGLARLPFYLRQAASGKVLAKAAPGVEVKGAVVRVDAGHGLAFPAVLAGMQAARPVAAALGLAAVGITRSHHFGVAGHPVERAARDGLVALAFSNTPAALPPWGGSRALMGTNPIAFACPVSGADPLVIDLSLSKVARGKVMLAAKEGRAIPEGWALDMDGQPTTDAQAALRGAMLPMGDAKGAALAQMVELLAAGLTGAAFGQTASSFFEDEGPPPGIGHLILLIDPEAFAPGFADRAADLARAVLAQPGTRLPGAVRMAARLGNSDTIPLAPAVLAELRALANDHTPP